MNHFKISSAHLRSLSICAVLAMAIGLPVAEGGDGPWVDRDGFPKAYSILTSDRLMYPDNVTDWPMSIDSKRQLFVDDYLISSIDNLTRQYHQPEKYADNPLMPGVPIAVWYDETSGLFRMWYGVREKDYKNTIQFTRKSRYNLYAESNDGINWPTPDIETDDICVLDIDGEVRGFIHNPDTVDPDRRFQAVVHRSNAFYLYRSPDGLNWKQVMERPILQRTSHEMKPGPYLVGKGAGDTSNFQYDPVLRKYTCSAKFNLYMTADRLKELGFVREKKARLRLRLFMESDDLIHWTMPRLLMFPDKHDDPDCQIYGHLGFVYESMWMGMVRVLHVIPKGFKQVDIQLAYSRDGRHWLRPNHRRAFIPLGGEDDWDADYLGYSKSGGPTLVGDELWFYYPAARNPARENNGSWTFNMGLAKLRRDGFVSLNAGQDEGMIITRPMTFTGNQLFINADMGENGWVKAAVLTRDSAPVASYTLDDSIALTENTTKGRMVWQSKQELVPPGDDHLRLVFQLKNTKLYSFWIE